MLGFADAPVGRVAQLVAPYVLFIYHNLVFSHLLALLPATIGTLIWEVRHRRRSKSVNRHVGVNYFPRGSNRDSGSIYIQVVYIHRINMYARILIIYRVNPYSSPLSSV